MMCMSPPLLEREGASRSRLRDILLVVSTHRAVPSVLCVHESECGFRAVTVTMSSTCPHGEHQLYRDWEERMHRFEFVNAEVQYTEEHSANPSFRHVI